jgi:hypothetical protein
VISQEELAARTNGDTGESGKPKTEGFPLKVANVFLIGGACLCLLVSFYFIHVYGWTAAPLGVTLFCVFLAVLAGLLYFSLKLQPVRRIRMAIVLFSTAASIYAVEIVIAFRDVWLSLPSVAAGRERQYRARLAGRAGLQFDTRNTLEVVRDLRNQGVDAYPAMSPFEFFVEDRDEPKSRIIFGGSELLPMSGISHKASVLCNESGEYVIYNSDEHGFLNPQGLWKSGRVDIAALGDSFTHGFCVSPDKNFVALIRKHYPGTLNLGILGHGPLLMLATLQEYLSAIKPKVVLWFYFEGNDLRDLRIERNEPLLMRYLTGGFSQRLLHRQAEIDKVLTANLRQFLIEKPNQLRQFMEGLTGERGLRIVRLNHLRQRSGLVLQRVHARNPAATYADELELFTKVLGRADESVSAWGGKLYFVYLPEWEPFGNPENVDGRREVVLEAVRALGIPLIDIHPAFQAQKDPLALFALRIDGHYNEEGPRVVAQEVLSSISVDNSN